MQVARTDPEANMQRRPLFALSLLLTAAALLTGLPLVFGGPAAPQVQGPDGARNPADLIKGKWQATVGGRPYILDLRLEEGDLVGSVQLPNRKTVNIEDGIFVVDQSKPDAGRATACNSAGLWRDSGERDLVDEFSFTTIEDDVEWEWSGTISESVLEGERERFDTDAHEAFTAKRQP
jgi:hypothetical protein